MPAVILFISNELVFGEKEGGEKECHMLVQESASYTKKVNTGYMISHSSSPSLHYDYTLEISFRMAKK